MTAPGEEAPDSQRPAPTGEVAASANIDQLGEITEVSASVSATEGASATVRGKGTPRQMVGLVFAPVFSGMGVVAALILILNDQPLLLAGAGFVVPQVLAAIWWRLLRVGSLRG